MFCVPVESLRVYKMISHEMSDQYHLSISLCCFFCLLRWYGQGLITVQLKYVFILDLVIGIFLYVKHLLLQSLRYFGDVVIQGLGILGMLLFQNSRNFLYH